MAFNNYALAEEYLQKAQRARANGHPEMAALFERKAQEYQEYGMGDIRDAIANDEKNYNRKQAAQGKIYNNPKPVTQQPANTADENYNVGYNLGAMANNALNLSKDDNAQAANGNKNIASAANEFMADPEAQNNMAGNNYYEPDLSVSEPTIQNADYADRVGNGYYEPDLGVQQQAPNFANIQGSDYADRWGANNQLRNVGYSTQGNITMPNGNVLPQEDEKKRNQQKLIELLAKGYPNAFPY